MANIDITRREISIGTGLGHVSGFSVVNIFGYNTGVTSVKSIDSINIAAGAGLPASAAAETISSGSANDAAAGTGARTVLVSGLDANYNPISETIILNGQTAVSLVNQYLRINDMEVMTAGSGGKNAGILYIGTGTVTTGVPAVIIAGVAIGDNRLKSVRFSVPVGNSLAVAELSMTGFDVSATLGTSDKVTVDLKQLNPATGLVELMKRFYIDSSSVDLHLDPVLIIPAKTDIYMEVTGTVSASVSANIRGYLVNLSS